LIHIEKLWAENILTVEGNHLHKKVDDPYFTETRHDVKVIRSMPIVSRQLGLYGMADVVEYHNTCGSKSPPAIRIIEYKRGKPKPDDRDEVQLCAQAMCLEEMLGINLDYGYFFYGKTRHRHRVDFNETLRDKVIQLSGKMHELFENGITPIAIKGPKCRNCSLTDLCLPILGKKRSEAKNYLKNLLTEMERETAGD